MVGFYIKVALRWYRGLLDMEYSNILLETSFDISFEYSKCMLRIIMKKQSGT